MLLQWVGVLALMHLVCVGADFIFEARLDSYQNPTHDLADGSCCDGPLNGVGGVCTDPCDNDFVFCMKAFNSTDGSASMDRCPFLHHRSSVFLDRGDDITFGPNEDLGGGFSNPLSFNGTGTWQGVRFLVRPRDDDSETNQNRTVIGTLITLVDISSGSDFSSVTFTGGLFLNMTVSFRVMCTGNSMGPDCSICQEGYEGDTCELMVTDECEPDPCLNGGTCTDLFQAFECICTEGFEGNTCESETVECSPGICENGGTCQDLFLDYMCHCSAGYEGRNCSEGTNECDPNPCQNGGMCEDLFLDYMCQCSAGYEGRNCSEGTNECDPNPCQNGGMCEDLFLDYMCQCTAGYKGRNCSEGTNECDPNPCQNGGMCEDLLADYRCSCASGFTGRDCAEEEEDGQDSVNGGVIGGAVAAGILLLMIVVLVVVLVMMLMKHQRHKEVAITDPGTVAPVKTLSGDNPVYAGEVGTFAKTDTQKTNTGSSTQHDFKNPLYDTKDDSEYATPDAKTSPQAFYATLEDQGVPPTHEYDYTTNETAPPKAPTGPTVAYDYADTPKPPATLYDNADDPATKLPPHTYSHPHASKSDAPPIHEYDYAGTGQPVYASPGDPPVVTEHYEMVPTDVGPRGALDPTDHYEFGPDV